MGIYAVASEHDPATPHAGFIVRDRARSYGQVRAVTEDPPTADSTTTGRVTGNVAGSDRRRRQKDSDSAAVDPFVAGHRAGGERQHAVGQNSAAVGDAAD